MLYWLTLNALKKNRKSTWEPLWTRLLCGVTTAAFGLLVLDLVLGWGALGSCGGAAVAEGSRQPILFSHRRWLIVEIQH